MGPRVFSVALALALVGVAAPARADLFSPGELSKGHAHLEGLKQCTSCHVAGQQLAPERCLDCHRELKERVAAGQGLHGRIPVAERACEKCHPEHQGRGFSLIEWTPSKKGFDHARTGWPLAGKHSGVDCARCHIAKQIADPGVRKLLAERPARETYLGLPTRCSACHFDEHRGQLGTDCDRCHSEKGFKPPTFFDHDKTAFPLEARHQQVACDKCHLREEDKATPKNAFPAPRQSSFVRFKGVAHAGCTDCHKDPHGGRFGATCVGCHTPAGWKQVRSLEKERGFHDKTRFPLKGAHASAECRACHGQPPKYRGLAFGQCSDCHADAHVGQIAGAAPGKAPDCSGCHGLASFKPPSFELEDHARSAYPLEGSHRAVACGLCHKNDPRLAEKVPVRTREAFRRQRRPERFSFARFDLEGFDRCESCHADAHDGQLSPARPCAACHEVQGFRPARFDHARDSRFPLTGRHVGVACARCHRTERVKGREVVRYKPLTTDCAGCHRDPHAGQFVAAGSGGRTDCTRCHATEGFKPARFQHAPPATDFRLEGRHAEVACERCHPEVQVDQGVAVRRYKPLPRECEGCHEDHHHGVFRGRESLSARPSSEPPPPASAQTRCAACHSVEGFGGAAIAHDRTGFPLKGAHANARCQSCHPNGFEAALPTRCAGCHRDAHSQELGQRCEGCHDETSWRSRFDAEAHRRTNFPLSGRHAFIPCEECHQDVRDRGFSRATLQCVACHERDYQRTALTSLNHPANGIPTTCQDCHDPWRFVPARFGQHEQCFQISRGEHAGIRCL
ncbi:MAG: hypothetical protein HY901_07420, partial [Deltaproteobacteria bacterium]|nr:hypothetical protein [Deltaproteobacteria bacterium]